MKYKVKGSWDGKEWWYNDIPRTCGPDFETEDLQAAIKLAESYVENRPFKHRCVVDEEDNVVWRYKPEENK